MKLKYSFIAFIAAAYHRLRGDTVAANTYDAAVETHETSVVRTNDAAVTARHLLWKKGASDDTVAICTAADMPIGTIDNTETSTGVRQTVLLLGKGGTKKMVAAGVIAAGVPVYSAAGGKVADSGTYNVGVSLTAAGADNDIIEVTDGSAPAVSAGVAPTLFDAHTILYATVDNTPAALTVAEQRIAGRITGGNIAALTGAQVRTITDPITWTATAVGAGTLAIPITHRSVNKTTGGAENLTLADGAFLGQRLNINLVVDGGDGTLAPTTTSGWTNVVLAEKGQGVELEWTTAGWRLIAFTYVTNKPLITVP